jgi:PleD family two-component response regulator
MTEPLALMLYERLLPGTQLVNRLQDLNYRVHTLNDPSQLISCAEELKPMLVLADLDFAQHDVCAAISNLRRHPLTQHLPVIAFGGEKIPRLQEAAQAAGVTLLAGDTALLTQLPQFLEQALHLE